MSGDVTNKPLSQADYEALARFRQALRNFMAFSDSQLEAVGMGPQRYQALLAIKAKPGDALVSVGELAELLIIKPNTAAELVNRLETAGLIERVRDPVDRRRALLSLTAAGAATLRPLDAVAGDVLLVARMHHLALAALAVVVYHFIGWHWSDKISFWLQSLVFNGSDAVSLGIGTFCRTCGGRDVWLRLEMTSLGSMSALSSVMVLKWSVTSRYASSRLTELK